jgi:glycosyltransferase involved in cell wall biosynthesis
MERLKIHLNPMVELMKVSVVIPTFNRGYILADALRSALEQSYSNIEILVIDDGSTDNTREIVEQFDGQRIRYIRHDKNRGCSAAYNTGIAAATGQLIAFLDSDDIWKTNYLETLVAFLARHPEADLVFCDTEIKSENGNIPSLIALMKSFSKVLRENPGGKEHIIKGRQMYVCLLEEVPIKPTAVLVKREMFERAGNFDEAWPSGTDWDLFLRFSHIACFGYINIPLVIQRRTSDATHQIFAEEDKVFLLSVFLKEKAKLERDQEALFAVNRGISSHIQNLASNYLESGQRKKSAATDVQGFKETGESMMLIRAASAVMPAKVREIIKGAVRGTHR